MVVILPLSLLADDAGRAMLHARSGNVSINGSVIPASQALLPDDSVQTQKDSSGTIDASGSTVTIDPETMVQFESDELILDHGSLAVITSRGMKVHIDCVTVVPVNLEWTQYTVIDVDGKVKVSALKNDVYLESRSSNPKQIKKGERHERQIVHEGEEKTREEKCGAGILRPVEAERAIFNTMEAKTAGIGLIIAGCVFVYCLADPNPMSPNQP
jgi:hypothetical protein